MMKRLLTILFFLPLIAGAQTLVTYDTTLTGTGTGSGVVWNARITRLSNYFDLTDSVQAIVFFTGVGEEGTDPTKMRVNGPHAAIAAGTWDGKVTLGNGVHYPIIITLQLPAQAYQIPAYVKTKIDAIFSKFTRIKRNSLHLTGLSHGGAVANLFATYQPTASDYSYIRRIKSVVNIQGMRPDDNYDATPAYPTRFQAFAQSGGNGSGGREWGFEQTGDSRDIATIVNTMNAAVANSAFMEYTSYNGGCHCAWEKWYGGIGQAPIDTFTFRKAPWIGVQMNIYQWMLRQGDTVNTYHVSAGNQNPTANAGADQSITLPTSSVTLAGSGSDADGTVSSHTWSFVSGPTTPTITTPSSYTSTVTGLITAGTYVLRLTVTDNNSATGTDDMQIVVNSAAGSPPTVNIGRDTTLPKKQTTSTDITLAPTYTNSPTSYLWTKLSGGTATLSSTTTANVTITGLLEGSYQFKVTATNAAGQASDTINVFVRDYMKAAERPCRVGAPQTFVLTQSAAGEIVRPYLRTVDGLDIQGGDTVKIPKGTWNYIHIGELGGSRGCPVIVTPQDSIVTISGNVSRFWISASDSNWSNWVTVDGTILRSKGIQYGFHHKDNALNPNTSAFAANQVANLEVKGVYAKNTGVGFFVKIFSDSTKPWRVYDNWELKNIKIHDNWLQDVGGEGTYLGTTDASGTLQAGNDGPPPRGDSLEVYNNLLDSIAWDGIQTSNMRYTLIHDNIVIRGGQSYIGSQNIGIFLGGNTTGKIYNNILYNSAEGIKTFGYGSTEIYNNYVDSTFNGDESSDGIYADQKSSYLLEAPLPKLQWDVHGNIVNRFGRVAIFHANNEGTAQAGTIHDNYIVHPTKTASQLVISNAGDIKTNNTVYPSFPVSIKSVGSPSTGISIEVNQNGTVQTFSDASSIYTWLLGRLTGVVNEAPTANAGGDQSITLPSNIITLAGSGSDVDGTIASYSWSQLSGPAQATITSQNSQSTSATFITAGTYVFRLTVTDDDGATGFDDITVTVLPQPTGPRHLRDVKILTKQIAHIPMNNSLLTIVGVALTMTAQSQNIASLRATTSPNASTLYYVSEQRRFFFWDSADDSTVDDVGSCIVSSNGKRFKPVEQTGQILPEHFGAKGDGVTDDTSPMQKAINYCSKIMGQIYLGGKTYVISTDTLKNNTNITGPGSIKHKTGSQWAIFYYPQVSPRGVPLENVSFNNVNFYGEKSPATDNWQSAIDIYYGKNIKINNVFARDFRASAFHLTDVSNVWINNIDLHNIGRSGGSNAVDIITSSTITPNDPSATQKIFIDKVSIDTCYTAGINVVGKIDSISTKVSITNCTVNYCPNFAGIALEAGSAVQNIVSTCQMYNCKTGFSSIITGNGGTVDRMRQNIFSDNIIDSRDMPNAQGIDIQGHNWNVCNNIIKSSGAAATIRGYNGIKSKNTIFSNNNITVSGDAVNLPFGVMVQDCAAPSITNNVAESENQYTKDAFYISDCDNVKANSNTAKGFGRNAFNVINVNVGMFNGNTVINPNSNNVSGSGISISGTSADVSLVGNDIRDNRGASKLMQYGVICSATTRNSAMNNVVYGGVNGIDATNLIVDGNIIDGVIN